jgi:hypothetical protein
MERETVSETSDVDFILAKLIARKDSISVPGSFIPL